MNIDFDQLEKNVLENKRRIILKGGADLFRKNTGRIRSKEDLMCLLEAGCLKAKAYPVRRNSKGEMILPLLLVDDKKDQLNK